MSVENPMIAAAAANHEIAMAVAGVGRVRLRQALSTPIAVTATRSTRKHHINIDWAAGGMKVPDGLSPTAKGKRASM